MAGSESAARIVDWSGLWRAWDAADAARRAVEDEIAREAGAEDGDEKDASRTPSG